MKFKTLIAALIAVSAASVVAAAAIGSSFVPPADVLNITLNKLFGAPLNAQMPAKYVSIIWDIRLPRALLAYVTGAALSMGGAVMQSLLANPLASPFGLGVSSGAGLGAAIVIIFGLSSGVLGAFLLPAVSLVFALLTVFAVIIISARLSADMSGASVVLIGMVVSLFCNALITFLVSAYPGFAPRVQLWQTGSFAMKDWAPLYILAAVTVAAFFYFMRYSREADIVVFGDEAAKAMGVQLKKVKRRLLCAIALLTGVAVAFTGIIGFVDLVMPYVARKTAGASHSRVLPAAALYGGIFLTLCDLAARTLAQPREIPIGAITAFLGAPFFFYIYFINKRQRHGA